MAKAGDIRVWNFQSDVYGGRYELVRPLGGGRWEAKHLEPTDEEIDAIMADVSPSWEGSAAFQEDCALRRIEQAGEIFEIKLVSSDEWARHF